MKIGLYPGTFDPATNGHVDILGRAVKLVDKLVVGVARNADKNPLFSLEERVEMMRVEASAFENMAQIEVLPMTGLLIQFAQDVGAQVIIRGLRAVSDFEYEFQMTCMNQRLNADIETVFFMADPQHQAISSRLIKEIARLGGDIRPFVSPLIARKLMEKIGNHV